MKFNIPKDWCINMAKLEDGQEISAGLIKPFRTTPDLLRDSANDVELNGTPSQAGMSANQLREVAAEMERMRSCFDTMQSAIEAEGYEVLINIDGTEISLRPRDR